MWTGKQPGVSLNRSLYDSHTSIGMWEGLSFRILTHGHWDGVAAKLILKASESPRMLYTLDFYDVKFSEW